MWSENSEGTPGIKIDRHRTRHKLLKNNAAVGLQRVSAGQIGSWSGAPKRHRNCHVVLAGNSVSAQAFDISQVRQMPRGAKSLDCGANATNRKASKDSRARTRL